MAIPIPDMFCTWRALDAIVDGRRQGPSEAWRSSPRPSAGQEASETYDRTSQRADAARAPVSAKNAALLAPTAGLEPATRRLTGGDRPLRITAPRKYGSIVRRDRTRSHRPRGPRPAFGPIVERATSIPRMSPRPRW